MPVTLSAGEPTREVEPKRYTGWITGSLAGSTTALRMPNRQCTAVMFKAASDNAGKVYIGLAGVTALADQTTNTTCGFQLSASEATPWLPTDNLNRFFRITTNAGDDLTYIAAVR